MQVHITFVRGTLSGTERSLIKFWGKKEWEEFQGAACGAPHGK